MDQVQRRGLLLRVCSHRHGQLRLQFEHALPIDNGASQNIVLIPSCWILIICVCLVKAGHAADTCGEGDKIARAKTYDGKNENAAAQSMYHLI